MIGPSTEELENSSTVMLQKHRGYYIKMIENTEDMLNKKDEEIGVRLKLLDEAIKEREKGQQQQVNL